MFASHLAAQVAAAPTAAPAALVHTSAAINVIKAEIVPLALAGLTIILLMRARAGKIAAIAGVVACVCLALTPLVAYTVFEKVATGITGFFG